MNLVGLTAASKSDDGTIDLVDGKGHAALNVGPEGGVRRSAGHRPSKQWKGRGSTLRNQLAQNTRAYVCIHVYEDTRPILYVTRADGDWCFLCGDGHPDNADQYRVVGRGHLIDRDPGLLELMDLAPEQEANRDNVGSPWIRGNVEPEAESTTD